MPRRYNLRPKQEPTVKWVEDDTLDEEEEEDDSTYVTEETRVEEEDEDEEEEDDEQDDRVIHIPMPKKGMRVKIEITNEDDFVEEEDDEEDGFLDYLLTKYTGQKPVASSSASANLPMTNEEQHYFDELPKSKQKKLGKQMKQLAKLVSDGGVPYKFRVIELPVADMVKANVLKKIDMLDKMDAENGESYKLRNWVDGFLRIPFGVNVPLPVKLDDGPKPCSEFLADTRKTLDKAVYGMQSAKTQIMQILAQWLSNPTSVGNVIALKGPMGVGKTSFSRNGIASVLKRPFEFFSLGGAADSSNFVGHSYTYEGSMWGRIADSLMNARCMNPVMYFDELDKISTTPQGEEIVNLLIHLTDRSQNTQFHDRYFAGVDFDLSQCLFVFSFNDESKVHPILKDRMQVIHCSGYSSDEKKIILTQYVWPQILERIKIPDLKITDEAIKFLIQEYSHEEEGVRTLMRSVETLVTRINLLRIADEETAKSYPFYMKIELPMTVTVDSVKHLLSDAVKTTNESWRRLYT
jgi:ATP-dependent Lon protease